MFNSFSNLFASGPKLSYEILKENSQARAFGNWKLFNARSYEDKEVLVSVFTMIVKNKEKDQKLLELARNHARRLKLCKHPNVLKCLETLEIENGAECTIHVVTVRERERESKFFADCE